MNQPQIGEIWSPVNSTRFGDVEVLSDGINKDGDILHSVRHVRSGRITEEFALLNGYVEFVLKHHAQLENE